MNASSALFEAVAVVLRRADGRFLFVRRAAGRPAAGYWTPVTGRPEAGETLPEAARREAREEVGLAVTIGREIYRCPTEGAPYLLVWFDAWLDEENTADSLRPQSDEISEARWINAEEIPHLSPMLTATRTFFSSFSREDRESPR